MSDDNLDKDSADAQNKEAEGSKTYTEEQFAELQEKLSITEANLEKSRKSETFNRNKRVELENQLKAAPDVTELQSKLETATKELDGLKTAATNALIDTALKAEIEKAGATSVSTVLKLVDRSKIVIKDGQVDTKTVEDVIGEVKKSDAVLFDSKKATPAIKQPGNGNAIDSFKNELKATKTRAEADAVYAKYGIKTTI